MSESFWKGAFAPTLKKDIGTVKFVPVCDMTPRDWRWLDFDNTRRVAQNRIASMVMNGSLRGFFQVMITEKAAKNEYFWPANDDMMQEYADGGHDFFQYNAETLTENQALEAMEELRGSMYLIPLPLALGILEVVSSIASDENRKEIEKIDEPYLTEMVDDDITLLLSILMMWEMELDEAEALLDDMPESDEVDEIRDWINDRVAEIEAGRRPIAAGRGL